MPDSPNPVIALVCGLFPLAGIMKQTVSQGPQNRTRALPLGTPKPDPMEPRSRLLIYINRDPLKNKISEYKRFSANSRGTRA